MNYNKICKKHIKKHVNNKIQLLCSKNNLKAFYNYINLSIGRTKPLVCIKSKVNSEFLNDREAASVFAKFVLSTYVKDNGILPDFQKLCNDVLDHIALDIVEIKMCLNSLLSKLSCGPDNIPNVFLKKLSNITSTPLALLFQKSIECSKIPQIWKHANVIPVFKGRGSTFDVSNYRPISLTSNICKVVESIVHKNNIKHCDKHKLLSNSQHDFRQQYSTTSNLLELLNDVTQDIDNNNKVDLITIDFSKAFDSISHSKLIHNLYSYGIQGKLLNWIKEFLNNRTFSVLINNIDSLIFPVISSVPQGSKTGPLFYILYANDLANIFKFAKLKRLSEVTI